MIGGFTLRFSSVFFRFGFWLAKKSKDPDLKEVWQKRLETYNAEVADLILQSYKLAETKRTTAYYKQRYKDLKKLRKWVNKYHAGGY